MSDVITQRIIGAAIEVHRILGPGLLEAIYQDALCIEFELREIPYLRQVVTDVEYKGHLIRGQKIDLLVQNSVVVELKSLSTVPDVALAQVLSYLKASGLKCALLINFGMPRLIDGIKRISL